MTFLNNCLSFFLKEVAAFLWGYLRTFPEFCKSLAVAFFCSRFLLLCCVIRPSPLLIHFVCFVSRATQSPSPFPPLPEVKQTGDSALGHCRKISQWLLLSSSFASLYHLRDERTKRKSTFPASSDPKVSLFSTHLERLQQ